MYDQFLGFTKDMAATKGYLQPGDKAPEFKVSTDMDSSFRTLIVL